PSRILSLEVLRPCNSTTLLPGRATPKTHRPGIAPGPMAVRPPWICTSHRNFDATILRLAHAIRRRHARVLLAVPALVDRRGRHAVAHQRGFDRIGTTLREREIVLLRAGEIGVASDRDTRLAALERGSRRIDDLLAVSRQRRLVELEEHDEHLLLRRDS